VTERWTKGVLVRVRTKYSRMEKDKGEVGGARGLVGVHSDAMVGVNEEKGG